MRSNLQTLSRPNAVATPLQPPSSNPTVPSIRLISATPSAAGNSSTSSTTNYAIDSSWGSIPTPLAPKADSPATRKRLVPKKSKLSMLGVGREKERGKDFSDVVRRVGGTSLADSASARGGFEIYVDPAIDDEIGEIVMVKKKKSRVALDGMRWGALGEVTNVPAVTPKEAPALLKVKGEEKDKWWSIGRGRKDSKEKEKEKAKEVRDKSATRAKSPEPTIGDPYPRSKTPEPLKISSTAEPSRARFNSLDSGILLNTPVSMGPEFAKHQVLPMPEAPHPAEPSPPLTYSRAGTPTAGGLLAPPGAVPQPTSNNQGSIAIRAMRSVRSLARIGSWAQLRNTDENAAGTGSVRVKAPKEKEKKEKAPKEKKTKEEGTEGKKKKEKKEKGTVKGEEVKKKKKSTKKKEEEKEKEAAQTIRMSSSSFEIGAASPMPKDKSKSLGKKKNSILGLGLPSTMSGMTMRLPTVRGGSTASSVMAPATTNRLSVESAHMLKQTRGRSGSVMSTSTGSSLRPLSTTSSMSGSRISSGSSVRWDEDCLENVKELRKRERREKEQERAKDDAETDKEGKSKDKESRRTSEGRKRTPLSEVFPLFRSESPAPERRPQLPIVTVEAATCDGHGAPDDYSLLEEDEQELPQEELPLATPVKRARPRPMSEQLLGRSRPQALYEGEDGVLSILDAATNDLAQLINHLDLEATPGTPDMTPIKPSSAFLPWSSKKGGSPGEYDFDSPTKSKAKHLNALMDSPGKKSPPHMPSVSSLRPYAQSRKNTLPAKASMPPAPEHLIGQPITPWPTLLQGLSPVKAPSRKEAPVSVSSNTPIRTSRLTHKRTMTPGPEPEPSPVFRPLHPAKSRNTLPTLRAPFNLAAQKDDSPFNDGTVRAPSLRTFGSPSVDDRSTTSEASPTPSPVFKRVPAHRRQRSSLIPMEEQIGQRSRGGSRTNDDNDTVPIPPEARRILGMSGTMGGSDVSCYAVPELDASDPDSDVPGELRDILANQSDDGDTMSYCDDHDPSIVGSPIESDMPLPSGPPVLELPTFQAHLIDDEENHADLDGGNSSEEDSTKKSFDFTGEIKMLNESGGSDRASFVEQLENAFRTPAKVDLRYGFASALLNVEVPPVPKLPAHLSGDSSQSSSGLDSYSGSGLADMKEPTLLHANMTATEDSAETDESRFEMFSGSRIVDIKEPTLLPGSDSLGSSDGTHDIIMSDDSASRSLRASSSSGSRPSDGQLNTSFRFGGLPKAPQASPSPQQAKPQTLSDIIPPPSHVRSLSASSLMLDDDSVLQSIFAKASDIPRPRVRVNSDSSVKRRARDNNQYRHSRQSSGMSFAGFESFDEVRRGFEFSNERPFYPPPAARRHAHHRQQESLFSIASVSSYGRAHDYGLNDPFDFGLPSLRERPSSEDMSMSMTVDDTFSFLDRQPRRRVESDASSFYFKAPMQSFSRGHRRHESNMSVSSQAPPVSLYNRSFGTHRRNDSSSSAQSVALSYATHGANGGRAAWARHRQDSSMDSVMSDFSAMRLGRPGIGDKMFDMVEHGMPLTAISASPSESFAEQRFGNRSSFDYDSIIDDRRSSMDDSLFEKTGDRSSFSSDSVFGFDDSRPPRVGLQPPPQYRPLSVLSMDSAHSPRREDDTMISMLGGGHVRRRSIEASPCPRAEKRKHSAIQNTKMFQDYDEYRESPNKARIVEKPSIASTSSYTFGGERMIKAKRGLLERQSLEDSCLIAEGEDLTSSRQNIPVFSRPGPATRSRSSTCTSSSGGDTPPLSVSDGFSSMDEGYQSSIDLSHVNLVLANATHPISTIGRNRIRARARGHGHRRRASHARASRSSVYETIEEEISYSPSPNRTFTCKGTPTVCQPIFIVEPDTTQASPGQSIWDDENGIIALRRYYALKDEAQTTVVESKRAWLDTPFSVFALQSFDPPKHPAGMQALLEHSVQNYGPLPSELRPRRMRSRTSSRPSPYPHARISKVMPPSPEKVQPTAHVNINRSIATPVLQQIPVNRNLMSAAPSLEALKPFSPLVLDMEPKRENAFGLAPNARPRVGSNARRTALGWSKRSTGAGKSSTDQKENVAQGTVMTPGESLRINRPRPRGRPTPASTARPIRV